MSAARKEAQAVIAEAKSTTQEEQNKKLAEVKAVRAPHEHRISCLLYRGRNIERSAHQACEESAHAVATAVHLVCQGMPPAR